MSAHRYDAIVVGARCAGSPTAMLLARKGYRVLAVDRATFPSDTVSTHLVHPPGVAALQALGPARSPGRDRMSRRSTPTRSTSARSRSPARPERTDVAGRLCPRRTVLDKLLVDAAAAAGAEVREGFAVEEVVFDGGRVTGIRGHSQGGATVTEHARVVVGADGLHSLVARAVDARALQREGAAAAGYYSYWSGLPMDGRFEAYIGRDRGFAAWPPTTVSRWSSAAGRIAEFAANKADIEGTTSRCSTMPRTSPIACAARAARNGSSARPCPNYFRKPFGPGWALVGDAGYNKDFITAQGIQDAFRDAELCVRGARRGVSGARRSKRR